MAKSEVCGSMFGNPTVLSPDDEFYSGCDARGQVLDFLLQAGQSLFQIGVLVAAASGHCHVLDQTVARTSSAPT